MKINNDYKWEKAMRDNEYHAKCPKCGYSASVYNLVSITPVTDDLPRYCPHCGEKMKEE